MKLKIEIRMGNAAFEPNNGTECARILRELAIKLDGLELHPVIADNLRDFNGNKVGEVKVTR